MNSYLIIDNVEGTYRYYSAYTVDEALAEVRRFHRSVPNSKNLTRYLSRPGTPPRYQVVPAPKAYSLYESGTTSSA